MNKTFLAVVILAVIGGLVWAEMTGKFTDALESVGTSVVNPAPVLAATATGPVAQGLYINQDWSHPLKAGKTGLDDWRTSPINRIRTDANGNCDLYVYPGDMTPDQVAVVLLDYQSGEEMGRTTGFTIPTSESRIEQCGAGKQALVTSINVSVADGRRTILAVAVATSGQLYLLAQE